MSSPVAAAYAPVGNSGLAEGTLAHIPLHRQRDENGVVPQSQRRKKWWWEPGPMETWSFFLTLRMGVTLTALLLLFFGCHALIVYVSVPGTLVTLQDQYTEDCGGRAAKSFPCVQIAGKIKYFSEIGGQLFPAILQDGLTSFVPGAIGLAAAYRADPRAVRLFLWTFLARCLVEQARLIAAIASGSSGLGKASWADIALTELFLVIPNLYFLKGIWSYQMQLLRRRRAAIPSPSGVPERGTIELDSVSQVV